MARIHIPSPCTADWEAMEGSDQKRFCNLCSKHVHDLSAMTKAQAERVLETPNVCVRFRQDDQGQVLHAPARPQRPRRLPLLALGALLGASPALAAPSVAPDEPIPEAQSEQGWVQWARQQLGALLGETEIISQREVTMGEAAPPPPLMGAAMPSPEPLPQPPVEPPPPPVLMGKPLPPIRPIPPPPLPEPSPEPLPEPRPGESVIPEVQEALDRQGR